MAIKLYLSTDNIDYAGLNPIPRRVEISDRCLKLHCYNKFSDELIQLINIHKTEGVRQRVGIWYLVARR